MADKIVKVSASDNIQEAASEIMRGYKDFFDKNVVIR